MRTTTTNARPSWLGIYPATPDIYSDTPHYTLTAMSDTETKSYLAHHLTLAGRSDPLFSDDATALIHQVGRGTPRAINNLAVQALVAAYAAGKAIVDETSARAAVTEVTTE